jgi:hypothetical protein
VTEHTSIRKWAEAVEALELWEEYLGSPHARRALHFNHHLAEKFRDAEKKIEWVLDFKQEWYEEYGAKVPGWLEDQDVDEAELSADDIARQRMLKSLRLREIPEMVDDLHRLLHTMGEHYGAQQMRQVAKLILIYTHFLFAFLLGQGDCLGLCDCIVRVFSNGRLCAR